MPGLVTISWPFLHRLEVLEFFFRQVFLGSGEGEFICRDHLFFQLGVCEKLFAAEVIFYFVTVFGRFYQGIETQHRIDPETVTGLDLARHGNGHVFLFLGLMGFVILCCVYGGHWVCSLKNE